MSTDTLNDSPSSATWSIHRWQRNTSNVLLFFLIAGMSGSTRFKHVRSHVASKTKILAGLFCQFICLPLLAYLVILLADHLHSLNSGPGLPVIYKVMILVVSTSPGGSYSNFICSVFNADMPLSIAMTTASTLAAAVMMPLNLFVYAHFTFGSSISEYMAWDVFFYSLALVIAGIGVGGCISWRLDVAIEEADKREERRRRSSGSNTSAPVRVEPLLEDAESSGGSSYAESEKVRAFAATIRATLGLFGNVCGIALIIFSAMMGQRNAPVWDREASFFTSTLAVFFSALLLPLYITRFFYLTRPERVTIAIEASYQNVGLATSLALNMYSDDADIEKAIGIPLIYGFWEMTFLTIFCIASWKSGWTYAPPGDRLCKVVTGDYQGRGLDHARMERMTTVIGQGEEEEVVVEEDQIEVEGEAGA